MPTCNTCHLQKDRDEFMSTKKYKAGHELICGVCKTAYMKAYREKEKVGVANLFGVATEHNDNLTPYLPLSILWRGGLRGRGRNLYLVQS